MSQLTRHCHK